MDLRLVRHPAVPVQPLGYRRREHRRQIRPPPVPFMSVLINLPQLVTPLLRFQAISLGTERGARSGKRNGLSPNFSIDNLIEVGISTYAGQQLRALPEQIGTDRVESNAANSCNLLATQLPVPL